MKRTVFYDYHRQLGARMAPYAGFEMPIEYEGVKAEHLNVRKNVGVFDVSHMGEIWIRGPKAFELVQRLTTNDVGRLLPGKIQYTCFPNEKGGIVDDLLVYRYEDEKYLLVVNASNTEKDYQWILEHNTGGAIVENASEEMAQIAVQGPASRKVLQGLCSTDLGSIPYYNFITVPFAGASEAIVSNTGYTGAGGFEFYLHREEAAMVWEKIFEAGKQAGLAPAGLAARDTLRLEMGFCLYGNEISEETSPLEAGLSWITKFSEGNDFINRPALEKQKEQGLKKRLVGFILTERGIPRQHYPLMDAAGNQIGEVTSGTMSPMLNTGIGMGYLLAEHAREGNRIKVAIRNKQLDAEVVKPPFYKAS